MKPDAVAPYGSWTSPIAADVIATAAIRLEGVFLDGPDVCWLEGRPAEQGRSVVVRRTPDGSAVDVTPRGFNIRTLVHEYGGGACCVDRGTVYFSNFADQRLYRQDPGAPPRPITPASDQASRASGPALHYADAAIDRYRERIVCIREDHTGGAREAVNAVVSFDAQGREPARVLASGHDFYSTPRLSPDGSRLAWLAWNHPNMPWDGCELWLGELDADGAVSRSERVAGGLEESIFQPEWSPDGVLYFVSDRTGWWNLYRWSGGRVETLTNLDAEFGKPQWRFGMSTYAFASAARIICSYTQRGVWHLAELDPATRTLRPIDLPYTEIGSVHAAGGRVVFLGGSPTEPPAAVDLDLRTRRHTVLRWSWDIVVDPGYVSAAEAIEFPTEGGATAHGFYYAPRNKDYAGPPGERPPLLVISHGGPTGATSSMLDLSIQFWTSRGLAVLDVNYGGSTGYGRVYRERLNDRWGIVDIDDCVNGARHLVDRGLADGRRLAIRGGSAGGYTTLAALAFRRVFAAGASYYGVSDLEALAVETHKFESRYLDRLVGPYPARRDLYVQRSPINFTDRLSCPLILFQGLEDKVVPPNQAERMFVALRAKGIPVAYVPFEGEQHGFRRAENIKQALNAELFFYSRVFGFQAAEPDPPVRILNLKETTDR